MKSPVLLLCFLALAGISTSGCRLETAMPPPPPLCIVQLCDPQLGFNADYAADLERLKAAVRSINALPEAPQAIFVAGDLANTNDDAIWEDFQSAMRELKTPYYCVPGNHDIGAINQDHDRRRFQEKIGPDHQSIRLDGYRFLLVNTQFWQQAPTAAGEAMDRWLHEELREARRQGEPVIIVGHVPLFVNDVKEPDGYSNIPLSKRLELLELFRNHGVIAILSGHTHTAFTLWYDGILFSSGENTSGQFDRLQPGYRMLEFRDDQIRLRTMPLE